jgi:hypothetical protein
MNLYFLLFTVPFISIGIGGILQVWDEMFGNQPTLPIKGMDRPTAKVQFGLLQPILARTVYEPLGLRAEAPIVRRPVREDSTIAPLIVVGDFSVLGSLTMATPVTAEPLLAITQPVLQPLLIPAWLESGIRKSAGHA